MPPPSIADTEECCHRACFRMAEVTVMHSVTTRATGSTATDRKADWAEDEDIAVAFDGSGPLRSR